MKIPLDRKFFLLSSGIIAALSVAMILARVFSSSSLLSNDSYAYLAFVRSVLEKGWIQSLTDFPLMRDIPPLLPIILLGGCQCDLSPVTVGLAVNYFCIILACQGVLFCSFRIYKNRFTALAAAILVCSLPKIYIEGCNIQRDPLFWAETAWLLYTLLGLPEGKTDSVKEEKRHRVCFTFSASILCALACLTRKEGLPMFCLTAVILFATLIRKKNLSWSFRIFLLVLFVFTVLIVIYLPRCFGIPFTPGSFLLHIGNYLPHD